MIKNLFSYRSSTKAKRTWQGILEDPRVMRSLFIKVILLLLDGLTKEWCIAAHLFWRDCRAILKRSGPLHLALYLKMCRVILMKTVAGDKLPEVFTPSVSITRGGLPRIIPSFHRKSIRQGSEVTVRLYMSLFSVSKLIASAAKIKSSLFKTITSPYDIESVTQVASEIRVNLRLLFSRYIPSIRDIPLEQGLSFVPTWKSVPSGRYVRSLLRRTSPDGTRRFTPYECSSSIFTSFFSELAAFQFLMTFVHARENGYSQGCLWMPFTRFPFDHFNEEITQISLVWFERRIGPYLPSPTDLGVPPSTGLLCQACTGDGKRRLFAIGNYINQRLLYPIHSWLMKVLRLLPMDGTFNQTRPIDCLKGNSGTFHSVDLKAATDRWPLLLLFEMIQSLFGRSFASSVVNSTLGSNTFQPTFVSALKANSVCFVAGQPLGYLSSWPLFALSHHTLIWHAAEQVYPGKVFKKYAVLGDDVVINDDRVREIYDELLTRLGVTVSLAKTLKSASGALEFAKRFRVDRGTRDLSPISIKALSKSDTPLGWYSILDSDNGRSVRFSTLMRVAGFGFKVASRGPSCLKNKRMARRYAVMWLHWKLKSFGIRLSLSYVLGRAIPPEVLGLLYYEAIESVRPRDIIEPPISVFAYPGMRDFNEYSLYQGWMKQYLAHLYQYVLLYADPDPKLDNILKVSLYKHEWCQKEIDKSVISFGLSFMLYDRCTDIIRRRSPRLMPLWDPNRIASKRFYLMVCP